MRRLPLSFVLSLVAIGLVGAVARAGPPVIREVSIDRGLDANSRGWVSYHQRMSARVTASEPETVRCVISAEPSGGRYVISVCAGGGWREAASASPGDVRFWIAEAPDHTVTCGWYETRKLAPPPPGPYTITVVYNGGEVVFSTPAVPEVSGVHPALLEPAPDSVTVDQMPRFRWTPGAEGASNWLQLREEGSVTTTALPMGECGQIWSAPTGEATQVEYNFDGTALRPALEPGRCYFPQLNSWSLDYDSALESPEDLPRVWMWTSQVTRTRFAVLGAWPSLPLLPGHLAYNTRAWADWNDEPFTIMEYSPDPGVRVWLASEAAECPDWLWDGSKLLYHPCDHGIWVDPLDGGPPVPIPGVPASTDCRWSPDGKRVVYMTETAPNWSPDIWVADADGTNLHPLAASPDARERRPEWSPDGEWIAYRKTPDYTGQIAWLIRPDGSDQHPLIATGVVGFPDYVVTDMYDPTWSPDAKRLAVQFWAVRAGGAEWISGIGTISRDGGLLVPAFLAAPEIVCCAAPKLQRWSPDGSQIVFASGHHLSPDPEWANGKVEFGVELWIVNVDGSGEPARLTYDYSYQTPSSWWAPNTPAGPWVSVTKGDATVVFETVADTGSTRMSVTDQVPGPAPEGYTLVGELWEGATTAQTRGDILIGLRYDANRLSVERAGSVDLAERRPSLMALLQWENGRWNDITVHVDHARGTVWGGCNSLSTYALAVKSRPRVPR